ncbi:hypothetical protein Mapa_015150 [Marchantia paleacea]|nr:hypothetical protein Mapa_015150 [Marchantia paleacea]
MEGAKVETGKRGFLGKDADSVQGEVHRSEPWVVKVGIVQALCGTGVFLGLWFVPAMMDYNLIDQPVETLRICFALSFPVLLISYSTLRLQPEICPMWWAAFRGLLSLPVGIVAASFVGTVFGAPISYESAVRTFHWAALISALTVVPVAAVVGGSWSTWHRLFARTEPDGPLELALCLSAHCAAIGSWVGAWPMPLDWERPWQEWPVCCTYGAVGGYLLSVIFSIAWYSANMGASRKGEKKKLN